MNRFFFRTGPWAMLVLLALTTFKPANVAAQVPYTAFTYQGWLSFNGVPANGSFDLQFSLHSASNGGFGFNNGFQTYSNVLASNGLFTTTVDLGNNFGGDRWLEIDARTNGGSDFVLLNPLQHITPVPYATAAENIISTLQNNTLNTNFATVLGGYHNLTTGITTVLGGANNQSYLAYDTVLGGYNNVVDGLVSFVGGGFYNSCIGDWSTIIGGTQNSTAGTYSTVGGGGFNAALATESAVGGGLFNSISNNDAVIGGGFNNIASAMEAVVSGGANNTAGGYESSVSGGSQNATSGSYSLAAGFGALAPNNGCFVWADTAGSFFSSTADNQFAVRASGGVLLAADVQLKGDTYHHLQLSGGNSSGFLYGSYPALGDGVHLGYNYYYDATGVGHLINAGGPTSRISAGYGEVILAVGGVTSPPTQKRLDVTTAGVTAFGTFNNSSDRNVKQDFAPVNSTAILDKMTQLPITEWSYKVDPNIRHIGPMGQDFHAAFNIGTDEKHIAPIDEGGTLFAAIQGFNQKLAEKDAALQTLEQQHAELTRRLDEVQQLLQSLTSRK